MRPVEQQADTGPVRLEPLLNVAVDVNAAMDLRVVDAFPGHRLRGLVAVGGVQIGVAEEQKKVLEVLDAAAHQIGKHGFQFGNRHGAGGDQVFVPFLMAGAGDQRYTPGMASFHHRIKNLRHGAFAAQQSKHHHSRVGDGLQQFRPGRFSRQCDRIEGCYLGEIGGVQLRNRPVCGQNVGVRGGHQYNAFASGLLSGQIL